MEKHLGLLGWKVKDKVTGFVGVVTHVGLDLYGCVQAIVCPAVVCESGGAQKLEGGTWFDVARLDVQGAKRVMNPIAMKGDQVVAGADPYKPAK